jgi:hypothetical protein
MSDTNISNEAVQNATGKVWKEWFSILDREHSTSKSHKEIASWLSEHFDISGWWAQMVTVQYERERGLRKVHEKKDGFEASKSKTFHRQIKKVFEAWIKPEKRKLWLESPDFDIRISTENKSIRISWPDETNVAVYFTAKGAEKTQVSIQHNKLPKQSDVNKRKAYWQKQINSLSDYLSSQA